MSKHGVIYKNVVQMVKALTAQAEDPELFEACDFGNAYGFLFVAPNKYENLYWCVNKKSYKPFTFTPNEDYHRYTNRKIIPKEEWTLA